jgi:predicted DNA-binding transcriptional regulator AlpA
MRSKSKTQQPTDDKAFLSGPQVRERYSITDVSLWRWCSHADYAHLGFPQPAMRINRRRFWRLSDLVDWERSRARSAAA